MPLVAHFHRPLPEARSSQWSMSWAEVSSSWHIPWILYRALSAVSPLSGAAGNARHHTATCSSPPPFFRLLDTIRDTLRPATLVILRTSLVHSCSPSSSAEKLR